MIISLSQLADLMRVHGAKRIYAKPLAPNDNSKNQVYLGGDFSVLNLLPHGAIEADASNVAGSIRDRAKAGLRFSWIDEEGKYPAPATQMILYPKYPEVRMSAFLKGCAKPPSKIMTARDEGRVLFLGVTESGEVLAYASAAMTALSLSLVENDDLDVSGVFRIVPFDLRNGFDTRNLLLQSLGKIYEKRWIGSQKLDFDGVARPYAARNGGGYTLEAELGVSPNGYAGPDYLGWEIKQYSVSNFTKYAPKSPVTLMTPEPTGGFYRESGVAAFLRKFGYPDKRGIADRLNFGGIYSCVRDFHMDTNLRLVLNGFDSGSSKITNLAGGIQLVSRDMEVAAEWAFSGLMAHWNRKHAQAAYVPSLYRTPPPEYSYGSKVLLCQQTDFLLFLKAMAAGFVYYDPGIKLENASSGKPTVKRRSQFRIKHAYLTDVYHSHEVADLKKSI
jgi:hypothetical protein